MNNFLATYRNAVNCTSCAVVCVSAINTPPICNLSDNQVVSGFIPTFYIGVTAYYEQ